MPLDCGNMLPSGARLKQARRAQWPRHARSGWKKSPHAKEASRPKVRMDRGSLSGCRSCPCCSGPLPGGVGVGEVDRQAGGEGEGGLLAHLLALVPGQRAAQGGGQVRILVRSLWARLVFVYTDPCHVYLRWEYGARGWRPWPGAADR
jgi:hypothetical protein